MCHIYSAWCKYLW